MAAKILPDVDYLRQCFVYDAKAGQLLWRERPEHHFDRQYEHKRWNARYAGHSAGAITRKGAPRLVVTILGSDYPAHRVIWKIVTGEEPKAEIDHRDRNGLNNQFDNLREAAHMRNSQNRKRNRRVELPKGVHRAGRKFTAYIMSNGISSYLGIFNSAAEAHAAYCIAAVKLHGEFANFG